MKKWVTYHGVAININPNIEHFSGIIPCGLRDVKISSLHDLNCTIDTEQFDTILIDKFLSLFNIRLEEIDEIK